MILVQKSNHSDINLDDFIFSLQKLLKNALTFHIKKTLTTSQ